MNDDAVMQSLSWKAHSPAGMQQEKSCELLYLVIGMTSVE